MKQTILLAALMLCTVAAKAQPKAGTFSIIPRLGVALATTTDELGFNTEQVLKAKYKAGFAGGVDFDYQLSSLVSVSAGAFYSMQGNRFGTTERTSNVKNQTIGIEDARLNLSYLSVPLMANVYVSQGLAVKAGLQMDFALDGKYKWDETTINKNEDGTYVVSETTSMTTTCPQKSVTMSIPVGLSYEYMNVVLDARYNVGLGNIADENATDMKKNSFMFTVGYRFAL